MATYDLGDVVTLSASVHDVDGDLADATDVTLDVTLPDGTLTQPTVSHPSVGQYTATYTPPSPGRYMVRWVATGDNASAFTDSFSVRDPDAVRTYLATVDDVVALGASPAQVTGEMLAQASARFRSEAQHPIDRRTYTQVLRAVGGWLRLPRTPVAAVDEVRAVNADGTLGDLLTGWVFDGLDMLTVSRLTPDVWLNGPAAVWSDTVQVTYTAGYDPIPEDVRWAVAAMVKRAAEAGSSGVTAEAIGDFSRSFGGYTASGAYSMTADERATAARYRTTARSLSVGRG
jgi:hypothetical protein